MPDIALLPDLVNILETTADSLLSAGERQICFKGKQKVQNIIDGILCLKRMGELLGRQNLLYRSAIQGINHQLNTDMEPAFSDDYILEAFVAEAVIQNLQAGYYVDITDIHRNFKHDAFHDKVCEYAKKYSII